MKYIKPTKVYLRFRKKTRLYRSCTFIFRIKVNKQHLYIFVVPEYKHLFILILCTVHLFLFCTLTNKYTIIWKITLLEASTLSCHPQGACNQYIAKLHKYFKCSCW